MLDLSRREAILSTASIAALMQGGAAAAFAQAATAAGAAAWDLSEIYPSDAAWEADRQAIQAQIPSLLQYKGTLGRSAGRAQDGAPGAVRHRQAGFAPVHICVAQGGRGPPHRGQPGAQEPGAGRVHRAWRGDRLDKPGNRRSRRRQGKRASSPPIPGSRNSRFGLRDVLRQAEHTLSPAEEKLLASAGTPLAGPNDIRDQLAASDIPRPTVKLSDGREIRLDDQGYTIARGAPNRDRPQAGLRQVLGKLQGVRKFARHVARGAGQGRHVPGQIAQVSTVRCRRRSTAPTCRKRSTGR